ncbi:MAG: GIY-YIG nuclease family protein [Pseudodesulfovibrio sp.]
MSTWHVYLLRCADGTFYCGITNNLDRRLAQHNAGVASKYTRSRTPVRLEASAPVESKGEALRLELRVKRMRRERKADFLRSWGGQPAVLIMG